MKHLIRFLLLSTLLFTLTGCASLSGLIYETRQIDTGQVVQTDFTDASGQLIEAGSPIYEVRHELKPWVKTAALSTGVIPIPYADVLGLIGTGLLSIGGVWLNQRKKRSDKVAESLVKGIDTFRDVLDQTPGGAAIDAELKRVLHDQQANLQVLKEIGGLIRRYATPAKQPILLPKSSK
jgi:hypothetical protein